MKKSIIALSPREIRGGRIAKLAKGVEHKALAGWGLDCAERVLSYFEDKYPEDSRPRAAIKAGREYVRTGVFQMAVIRKAALDSHAAAREAKDDAARSAARAAGQAVAAAHVPSHALAAAAYAATAIRDAIYPADAEAAIAKEREWQYKRLARVAK